MKQKIVIRVGPMNGGRSLKTLRTVIGVSGVESAAIKGDQVEVVGCGIPAVVLVKALRKNVAAAYLISVIGGENRLMKLGTPALTPAAPQ